MALPGFVKEYRDESVLKYDFPTAEAQEFPLMVVYDITNVCNLQCPHCPQPMIAASKDYKPTHLDYDLYKKSIDEIAQYPHQFIRFTGDGEPMIHSKLVDMIDYAKKAGIAKIDLTTNGWYLTERNIMRLLQAPLDIIDVSLDAFTKKNYDIARKGSDYNRVLSNLHHLIYLRNREKAPLRIMVSFIDQPLVHEEVEDFRRFWTPLVDNVMIRPLHTAGDLIHIEKPKPIQLSASKSSPEAERYPCTHLWKRVTIGPSGTIHFCAVDWEGKSIVGHLKNTTIYDHWHGKTMQEYRQFHLNGEFHKIAYCKNCVDWKEYKWDLGFEHQVAQVSK